MLFFSLTLFLKKSFSRRMNKFEFDIKRNEPFLFFDKNIQSYLSDCMLMLRSLSDKNFRFEIYANFLPEITIKPEFWIWCNAINLSLLMLERQQRVRSEFLLLKFEQRFQVMKGYPEPLQTGHLVLPREILSWIQSVQKWWCRLSE